MYHAVYPRAKNKYRYDGWATGLGWLANNIESYLSSWGTVVHCHGSQDVLAMTTLWLKASASTKLESQTSPDSGLESRSKLEGATLTS